MAQTHRKANPLICTLRYAMALRSADGAAACGNAQMEADTSRRALRRYSRQRRLGRNGSPRDNRVVKTLS